jgi:hypothetical protein
MHSRFVRKFLSHTLFFLDNQIQDSLSFQLSKLFTWIHLDMQQIVF